MHCWDWCCILVASGCVSLVWITPIRNVVFSSSKLPNQDLENLSGYPSLEKKKKSRDHGMDTKQCEHNPNFTWSSGVLDQWNIARQVLRVETFEDPCDVERTLEAYLSGRADWIGLKSPHFGGIYDTPRGFCEATWKGTRLMYARVYKGGNNAICRNLQDLDDGSVVVRSANFSFVRDPLEHFTSGYSEIAFRSTSHPAYTSSLYSFKRVNVTDAREEAFIIDFITGKLHRVRDITDAHCFPQVAFLSHVSLAFLGELDNLEESWSVLGKSLHLDNWPKFNSSVGHHNRTDAKSHFSPREAMQELLLMETDSNHIAKQTTHLNNLQPAVFREALCRVLLPDYICLNYALPQDCAKVIGNHGIKCPFQFPARTHQE
jgi:hypothetical protein